MLSSFWATDKMLPPTHILVRLFTNFKSDFDLLWALAFIASLINGKILRHLRTVYVLDQYYRLQDYIFYIKFHGITCGWSIYSTSMNYGDLPGLHRWMFKSKKCLLPSLKSSLQLARRTTVYLLSDTIR